MKLTACGSGITPEVMIFTSKSEALKHQIAKVQNEAFFSLRGLSEHAPVLWMSQNIKPLAAFNSIL